MFDKSNRIASFFNGPIITTTTRTTAQREASRRNGVKSKGPVTVEGKAKSRLNSMRHGLLAKVICPPDDAREQDRMFRFARSSLIADLKPVTFSDYADIDALAHDYVQLARARQYLEMFQRPATMGGSDAAKWEQLKRAKDDLKQLRTAAAWHTAGQGSPLTTPVAARVAKLLADIVSSVAADVAAADEEERDSGGPTAASSESVAKLAEMERDEMRPLRKLLKTVGTATTRFADTEYLTSLLTGTAKPVRGDGKRLTVLLAYAVQVTTTWINGQRDLARRMTAIADTKVAAMSRSKELMEQLLLLDRYRARIESAIEKKLQRFADR